MAGDVMQLDRVRKALPELEQACRMAMDVSEAFRDACKATAKNAGVEPAVLTAYVKARVQDKLAEHEKKAEQMTLLLEECDG